MPSRRLEQVADLLRAELSDLLRRELQDPRVGFVTITGVEVSPDLRNARVHVSCYGDEQAQQESIRALRHAAGFLRRALNERVRLRTIPQLDFRLDRSMAEAEQVQRALRQLAPELEASAAREQAEAAARAATEGAETGGEPAGRAATGGADAGDGPAPPGAGRGG
jgi:ribosome-binding factor A